MSSVISFLADFFGWLMNLCYQMMPNYYVDIIIFTLITKILQFPLSLWCHKNSLTMVQLMPELNKLKVNFYGDNDRIGEESAALFKREHYHPLLSLVPIAVQIIILMGFVEVIYRITKSEPTALLAQIPVKDGAWSWVMPFLAGGAAWFLGFCQDRINPLQREQSKAQKMTTNGISIAISLFLGCFVSFGVGLYWVFSNIFSILVQLCCNWTMRPEKYINYRALYRSRIALDRLEKSSKKTVSKEDRKREKADYKRFFNITNKHLCFYSESSGFYKYYQPLVEWLLNNSTVVIHYVTNDPQDQVFKLTEKFPKLKPYYIGPRMIIPLMMKMDADIVVMTTPDLNRYHIKRSYVRKDVEYIYLHHSLTSLTMCTREGAYDHYDTIFSAGPHQSEEIQAMEKEYKTPEKKLVPFGYALLDKLIEQFNSRRDKTDKKQILIAPSYQDGNILDSILDTVLKKLQVPGWRVIVRPHPQYVRRFPTNWNGILAKYEGTGNPDLIFETDFSSNETIYNSDVLITDWSGIAYEFSFTTGKPSLFFNTPMKVINPNYSKFGVPTDISFRDEVGLSLDPSDAERVDSIVREMLENDNKYREKIFTLREKCLFNIGKTGAVGGKYIIDRLIALQKERKNNQ